MKKIFLILSWVILCSSCSASNTEDTTNSTSNTNPTSSNKPVKDETPKSSDPKEETAVNEKRYFEEIFSEVIFETFTYGNNTTQGGKNIDLKLDVYQPKGDTKAKRPLIIYIHGGGFTMNSRNTIKNLGFLQTLAKSGFVVASIDYRLIDAKGPTAMPIGILNAMEDTRAAIRFFRKDAATENKFKIDTDQIIMGGYSAGAITTLFTTYLNSQQKVDTFFPPLSAYVKANGGIEGNSGNPGYSSKTKGIFNVAGGISKTELMDNSSTSFIYSLHGINDTTVAIGDSPQLKGSKLVHKKAIELGIISELNAPTTDHGILYSCAECRIALQQFLAKQVSK